MRLIIILLLLVFSNSSFAGGWVQAKGKGYYKLSEYWIIFDNHFTDRGRLDPNVTTSLYNTNLYVEHGLSNRVTGVVNANLFSRNLTNNLVSTRNSEILVPGDAINSIGDLDLGLKYALIAPGSRFAWSLSASLGLPTGKIAGGREGNLATGDGEFNQILRSDFGKGWSLSKRVGLFGNTYAGLNNRTRGFSDELHYGLEAGLMLFDQRVILITKLNVVDSFKNGETAATYTNTSIFANNTEYTSIAFEANAYVTKRLGLSASIATAARGELIAAAPSYSIGIFLDTSR